MPYVAKWVMMLDSSIYTRYLAAGSPHTPTIVLVRLAADANEQIRRRVAENQNAPPELLRLLVNDRSVEVRTALLDNPSFPLELIAEMLRDASADVRFAIAENHNMLQETLMLLCMDENPYVAERAERTLARAYGTTDISQLKGSAIEKANQERLTG